MIEETNKAAKEKMQKTVDALLADLSTLKAGRANPQMLDKIVVDYYGTPTQLKQMAAIASPEPRILTVQPWDVSAMKNVEKAIMASDLGLNPSNDGKIIRLVIPQLTEERRKELVKVVGKNGEECKVALRNIRRASVDSIKKAEKDKQITEDDVKNGEKLVQKTLDEFIKKVDEIIAEKEKDILTV